MPKAIGRHQVSRLLGEGAMGRVYLATDPELGRDVAIKVLRLDAAGAARDAYIARFRNEARAAARFMHPNVVAVYDAGVDPTLGPYLVYEFVPGPTLRARIEQGGIPSSELVALAKGVGAALDALHAAGIIHRDIKPDNILLSPTGAVKLTDFGIARVPDAQLTRDGQFLGTPAYASPEAITRGEYSARGDVFSLAAVLYESLCGIRPFPGDDAVAVSYAVANETAPPPSRHIPGLSPAVDMVFGRGLAKKSNERFASAGEFALALSQAFRGDAVSSAMATTPLAPKRPQHAPTAPAPSARGDARGARPPVERPMLAMGLLVLIVATLAVMVARRWSSNENEATPAADSSAPSSATAHARTTPAPAARAGAPGAVRARPGVAPRVTRDAGAH